MLQVSRIEEMNINLQKDIAFMKRLQLLSTIFIFILLLWIIYSLSANFQSPIVKETCTVIEPNMTSHDEV